MSDFSYINIYATKGFEYLWVIGYLLLLAGFGPILMGLGRKSAAKPASVDSDGTEEGK